MGNDGYSILYQNYLNVEKFFVEGVALMSDLFRTGCFERRFYSGCLITFYDNGSFNISTDENNLENLEKITSKENLPFNKFRKRQKWNFSEDGWKDAGDYIGSNPFGW